MAFLLAMLFLAKHAWAGRALLSLLLIPSPNPAWEWLTEDLVSEKLCWELGLEPMYLVFLCFFWWPSHVSVRGGPAGSVAIVPPDNLLEMQNLRFPHQTELNQNIHSEHPVNIKILKALLFMDYTSIYRQSHAYIIPFLSLPETVFAC